MRLARILKPIAVVGLAWVLFVGLGDLLAWLLRQIGLPGPFAWQLYAIALAVSVACAATALYVVRSGRRLSAAGAFVLGGVGAFTATELGIFAIPDWNPVPISAALLLGLISGLTVYRAWTQQSNHSLVPAG